MLFDSKWTNKVKMSYLYASKFVFKDSIEVNPESWTQLKGSNETNF